jgi:rubrerythrin
MVDKRKNLENKHSCGVKECNNKYICESCGASLEVDHDCPTCGQKINWGKAMMELRMNPRV